MTFWSSVICYLITTYDTFIVSVILPTILAIYIYYYILICLNLNILQNSQFFSISTPICH